MLPTDCQYKPKLHVTHIMHLFFDGPVVVSTHLPNYTVKHQATIFRLHLPVNQDKCGKPTGRWSQAGWQVWRHQMLITKQLLPEQAAQSSGNDGMRSILKKKRMECNIAIVGDRGVGKTSLVKRFLFDSFSEESNRYKVNIRLIFTL